MDKSIDQDNRNKKKNNIVILDRDGVINADSDNYIKTLDEWIPIDGSIEAIAKLKHAGYTVAIATNQSGIGRGYYSVETLNAMHQKLADLLAPHHAAIDYIAYCPHLPEEGCACRKPKTALFDEIAKALSIDLNGAIVVGDSLRDLQAGVLVACQPVLVLTGKGQATFDRAMDDAVANSQAKALPDGTRVFDDLSGFVKQLIG
jgi:D-glycero-D-manno-heptose 1,7-bisphosphate phosphatase